MKNERILIDENVQFANQQIQEMKVLARQATELIQAYNRLPVLSPIDLATDCREFLTNPVAFLDESILNHCGVGLPGKPVPSALASLYGIPYDALVSRSKQVRLTADKLALLAFDEGSHEVILMPEAEDRIREQVKIFLTLEAEIAEYERLKSFTDQLNELCDEYNVGASDKNQLERSLSFVRCYTTGREWKLKPSIEAIRKHLKK